jgi:hypothetical protein
MSYTPYTTQTFTMNNTQDQPRHLLAECTQLSTLSLDGRLSLVTINESPPGSIPDNLGGSAKHPTSFQRLHVLCGPMKNILVKVDYVYYESNYTFQRDNCLWYLCHTWTRTWGDGADSTTVFINLDTGDRYDTDSLSFWRGSLTISPNGYLALITGGIYASSDAFIGVVDLSNLPLVELLHYEIFFSNVEVKFQSDNTVVFTYPFIDDNHLKEMYVKNNPNYSNETKDVQWGDDYGWSVVVVRTKCAANTSIWSDSIEYSSYGAPYDKYIATKYDTSIVVDKMTIVSETTEKINE